ncbi:MAG: caspase family protein [Alphaproteobacteria bacterium]
MTLFRRPKFCVLALAVLAGMATSPAWAQAPAPYWPLPAGAVLDYGSWRCTVRAGPADTQLCAGSGGAVAGFFAKLVPYGDVPQSGYGTHLAKIYCDVEPTIDRSSYIATLEIERITLDAASRRAILGLWPLSVGKKAIFKRGLRDDDDPALSEITVVGTRRVTVAGVQREVYVLNGRTRKIACYDDDSFDPEMMSFDEVWWYAPDIAAIVHYKIDWPDLAQWGQNVSYDLKSLTLPPGAAVARAIPPKAPPRPAPPLWAQPPPRTQPLPQANPRPPARPAAPVPVARAPAVDREAPVIEVRSRLDTKSALVRIGGRVVDRSRVIELTVNGAPVPIAADGSFEVRRGVPLGTSRIEIGAMDEWGNSAKRRITVVRAAARPARRPSSATTAKTSPSDPFAGIHFGTYNALVIGNDRYRYLPKLKTATKDAWAVSSILTSEYGFKVRTLIDATRSQILGALATMRAELKSDDNLLIYYGGHGVVDSITEQGYWLPVDAEERNPSNWISNSDLTDMLRGIRSRHVMVVADSCYSGTLVRAAQVQMPTARDEMTWLKRVLRLRARTALVSGGLEPVVDGGGDGHSVFAKAFLNALKRNDGIMEGRALFNAIKRPVVLNADQTPQYSDIRRAGHEGGEFIFRRRGAR